MYVNPYQYIYHFQRRMDETSIIRAYVIRNYEEFFNASELNVVSSSDDEDIIHGASAHNGEGLFDKCKTVYDVDLPADVVFLSARSELVKCWKKLKELHLLDRTVLVLDESSAVDWKCGTLFLKHFHKSFPAFLSYRDDFIDGFSFFPIRPIGFKVDSIEPSLNRFDQRRLLCMVCANKSSHMPKEMYSVRKKCINYFESHLSEEFDLYGPWWSDRYSNWRGTVRDKKEAYHNHKFALCIENSYEPGYITEKIFDCFRYGIVPVYAGPPNVDDYLPADSYISFYKFKSIEELVEYLKHVSETEYNTFLEHAKSFIESEKYTEIRNNFEELSQRCTEILSAHNRKVSLFQVILAGFIDSLIESFRNIVDGALKMKNVLIN